ncbi:unnamed protein product [Lactuca saligna]|uniref:Reverse transcriptase zinc-binding domain-containing protein n=1 Tax=Lactuca saligna TaxID=75948 RepID=A0AA35ZR17_LACSI|nr:unnamed protein product [Lactuca saligna]
MRWTGLGSATLINSSSLINDVASLKTLIGAFNRTIRLYAWTCPLSSDGYYTVDLFWERINGPTTPYWGVKISWSKDVPIKGNCFVWRANFNRISTASALIKQGVRINSAQCGHCRSGEEDIGHLFT